MKKIKVVFIKVPKIKTPNPLTELAEQEIHYTGSEISIKVPEGYAILTVTEILQPIIMKEPPLLTVKN